MNRFVADFIGLTNFLPGRIEEAGDSRGRVRIGDVTVEVRLPMTSRFAPGSDVEVGIRAAKIAFGRQIANVDIQFDAGTFGLQAVVRPGTVIIDLSTENKTVFTGP